jgi:hypothetical protein
MSSGDLILRTIVSLGDGLTLARAPTRLAPRPLRPAKRWRRPGQFGHRALAPAIIASHRLPLNIAALGIPKLGFIRYRPRLCEYDAPVPMHVCEVWRWKAVYEATLVRPAGLRFEYLPVKRQRTVNAVHRRKGLYEATLVRPAGSRFDSLPVKRQRTVNAVHRRKRPPSCRHVKARTKGRHRLNNRASQMGPPFPPERNGPRRGCDEARRVGNGRHLCARRGLREST